VTHEPIPQDRPARVVARLAKHVDRALHEVDLSLAQYRVLGNLADGPSLASTLAERLIVTRPSVTALVDGLVERGLVTRTTSEDDRRRVMHVLTTDGRKVLAGADGAIERRLEMLAGELPESDRTRAYRGLESWGKALHSYWTKLVKEKTATR